MYEEAGARNSAPCHSIRGTSVLRGNISAIISPKTNNRPTKVRRPANPRQEDQVRRYRDIETTCQIFALSGSGFD
jgi:hypothetical protein